MGNVRAKLEKLNDLFFNITVARNHDLSFVVEQADWIIKRIGLYVTGHLNTNHLLRSRVTTIQDGLKNQIVHFGSINTFHRNGKFLNVHPSNKIILTWFHLLDRDEKLGSDLAKIADRIHGFHTACRMTQSGLVRFGIPEKKIHVIPLGVNVSAFRPVSTEERRQLRKREGIPEDAIVIGSFQKDGEGWDKGAKPKLIKGPDILVEVCRRLTAKYPVFVLLVGPARGYVESKLKEFQVPYKTVGYLKNFYDIAAYYQMLDFYLITSRIEGGPQQILEAWASGIPVVSTKVGMIADIARQTENALLSAIEDIDDLVNQGQRLLEDAELRRQLIQNGLRDVQQYAWENISRRYFEEVYSKIL